MNSDHVVALQRRYEQVELVLFDVDGVLTDGTLFYSDSGEVLKNFNAKDGFAFSLLQSQGIRIGVVSGKASSALKRRLDDLDVDIRLLAVRDKTEAILNLCRNVGVRPLAVALVGDDVADAVAADVVGLFFAPQDAHSSALEAADVVLLASGGHGVAREVAERLLEARSISPRDAYLRLLQEDGNLRQ